MVELFRFYSRTGVLSEADDPPCMPYLTFFPPASIALRFASAWPGARPLCAPLVIPCLVSPLSREHPPPWRAAHAHGPYPPTFSSPFLSCTQVRHFPRCADASTLRILFCIHVPVRACPFFLLVALLARYSRVFLRYAASPTRAIPPKFIPKFPAFLDRRFCIAKTTTGVRDEDGAVLVAAFGHAPSPVVEQLEFMLNTTRDTAAEAHDLRARRGLNLIPFGHPPTWRAFSLSVQVIFSPPTISFLVYLFHAASRPSSSRAVLQMGLLSAVRDPRMTRTASVPEGFNFQGMWWVRP
ncbi:hypothetical protein MSAN_02442200 [Mycena sanguinolenta]|uniref:Uncharacterized protein n=1 Tax=Mycena sanguinolenta TaxID=230812 RepID=A0A8H6WYP1_9AGAR|nr:hypothetical protein MSAN_02442200 [Mycena sanguinolenta]